MMTHLLPVCVRAALAGAILVGGLRADTARAEQPHAGTPTGLTYEQEKRAALDWLDRYQTVQVIFPGEHIERLRAQLEAMPPDEAHRWFVETAEVRALLESPLWRETRRWLRAFLRVQAVYSDDEIEGFRARAAAATPRELVRMLEQIIERREVERRLGAASEHERRDGIAMRERQLRREADSSGRRWRRAADFGAAPSSGTAYGRGGPGARHRIAPPLITSREMAREAVFRSLFGAYWGWPW